jgi:hypothetical protein
MMVCEVEVVVRCALQVLHLYMVPQIGPAQVLKAQHKPPPPVDSPKQQPRQEPTAIAYAAMAGRHSMEGAGSSAAERLSKPVQYVSGIKRVQQEQQQQHNSCADSSPRAPGAGASSSSGGGGHASSTSSSVRRQDDADEALLLNIAERDLAEVAHAIAAAAGPTLDAELAALLAGASASAAAIAAGAAHWGVGGTSTAEAAGESGPVGDVAVSSQQQEQQQQQVGEAEGRAGTWEPAAGTGASAAVLGAAGGAEADAVGDGGLRLPRTLPGVRSWRARLGPASQQEGEFAVLLVLSGHGAVSAVVSASVTFRFRVVITVILVVSECEARLYMPVLTWQ